MVGAAAVSLASLSYRDGPSLVAHLCGIFGGPPTNFSHLQPCFSDPALPVSSSLVVLQQTTCWVPSSPLGGSLWQGLECLHNGFFYMVDVWYKGTSHSSKISGNSTWSWKLQLCQVCYQRNISDHFSWLLGSLGGTLMPNSCASKLQGTKLRTWM